MRLEEVHASLFREHKNLQEDYERIHVYVEVIMLTCTTTVRYTCLQICNNPKIAIDTVGIGNEIRSRIAVKDTWTGPQLWGKTGDFKNNKNDVNETK